MISGSAGADAEAAGASVGGGGGDDSVPPPLSWTVGGGGGDVAQGGLSLKDPPPWGEVVGGVKALAALLFLKTSPSPESSSSDGISSTLFPLSRGAGAGDEATTRGTTAMGGGEFAVCNVWGLCAGEDGPSGVSEEVGV